MFQSIKDIKNPGQSFLTDAPVEKKILSSKVSKQIRKIKEPVPRYFESLNQIQGYWSEGEYDLMEIFKLLKFEAWFFKSVQKKTSLLIKSGFSVRSDDDEITEYIESRFQYMGLQTGESLDHIIEKLAYYLFICSNAFLIKVRDPDFQFASSYMLNEKEMHPVVGLFLAHPTQIKPRFQWVRFNEGTQIKHKLQLTKWVFVNRRGIITEFDPCDVAHFHLHKEDGMIFGTPEIVPAIDDIRTLRKMEEDIGLLSYRDLFPIIHYTVKDPGMIDHLGGISEIDAAKRDLERMMQDGGIATDERHQINYIGSQGKHMELKPYLEYFRDRVFSGLGVSCTDMGIGADIGGATAQSMSKQIVDAVRYVQQEMTRQFDEMIVTEMMLQSPFGIQGLKKGSKPTLAFEEIDIEWKIKTENHEADQFTKGVTTIDEVRNRRGAKTLSDEHLKRTHPHMYGTFSEPAVKAEKEIKSAAERDSIKSSKTNSNVTKSTRKKKVHDSVSFLVADVDLSMQYKETVQSIADSHPTGKKFSLKASTNDIYRRIKERILYQVTNAIQDASDILEEKPVINMEYINTVINFCNKAVDTLCEDVTKKMCDSDNYVNKAAVRIATTDRTEQVRAYNLAYATVCIENGVTNFLLVDFDTDETRDVISLTTLDKSKIPPLHPNSKVILKAVVGKQTDEAPEEIQVIDAVLAHTADPVINVDMTGINNTIATAMNSFSKSVDDKIEPLLQYIEKLKIETAKLTDVVSECLTQEDIKEIQSALSDKLDEMAEAVDDKKEFTAALAKQHVNTIEAIIDSIKGITKENNASLRAMAESFPKEITVNTQPMEITVHNPPMEVTVNNPPMEVNLTLDQKDQKTSTKRKINVVRDSKGQILSAEVEEE